MQKISVMMICLGNICRSPMAEAVLRYKVKERGLQDRIQVDSCGTSSYHVGENADPRTRRTAARHQIPMDHTVKQFHAGYFDDFDYLLVMDHQNKADVLRQWEREGDPAIFLLGAFDTSSPSDEVFDPYYGDEAGFEENYRLIDRACDGLLEHLRERP